MADKRLCLLSDCRDQFEIGRSGDRQVLFGVTVGPQPSIVAHWFSADGEFLGIERVVISTSRPTFPGTTIFRPDEAYETLRKERLAEFKARIGFEERDIRVERFESEEARITDLPYRCEEFARDPSSFPDDEQRSLADEVAKWHRLGGFVVRWGEERWFSADGRCIAC